MPDPQYFSLPKIIAHRCNDEASIEKALALKHQQKEIYMECDVRTTADGVLVAHHDPKHRGKSIRKTPFSRLEGSVLSLDMLLDKINQSNIPLHLDVKAGCLNGKWKVAADSEQLYGLLEQKGFLEKVMVTSIKGKFLRHLRQLAPQLRLGVLYDKDYGELMPPNRAAVNGFIRKILEFHEELLLDAIFLNQEWLHVFDKRYHVIDKFFYILIKAGLKIAVWTVNEKDQAMKFMQQGAEWVTTDIPEIIDNVRYKT